MLADVIIVGGGVSGLATAFYLNQRGIRNTVVEASGRLGGLIRTDRVQGCDLEGGPDSFISTKPAVAQLSGELGISNQLMGSNDSRRRVFVVRGGKLIAMPHGMVMMVPSDWAAALGSPLFSLATKTRFLREYHTPPHTRLGDFSIRDLVLEHFGEEALDYLTEPLLAGVYGGNAAALSAPSVLPRFVEYESKYGSLIKGVRQSETNNSEARTVPAKSLFLSFEGGMQTLIDSLAAASKHHTELVFQPAKSVRPEGAGWSIELENNHLKASQVVLACPAHKSAELLAGSSPELSELLAGIPYSSSTLVTLLFDRKAIAHPLDGFGFLVPPPERQTIAAVTWISTKFPSRVAPEFIGIRAFLVDPQAEAHAQTSESELVALVLRDLKKFMGVDSNPAFAKAYRWPRSMPQYVVGHSARIARINEQLSRYPGLHLTSNYLDGVGIPDCVRNAQSVASAVKVKNHSSSQ